MKAVSYNRYGPPDVLQVKDVEKPVPQDGEVLIKVRAASVNPLDWHLIRGRPYIIRLMSGLPQPKTGRPGRDVAGRVEAVGSNVRQFKPGDDVLGSCEGALAEYVCASERELVMKPEILTFEQAASAPVAALTALQGLRDKGRIRRGQKVLINGASGGVGTFAVQIARWFGADVTGVCSTRNVDMVRALGAGEVIDYTRTDFTAGEPRYDIVFDCIGNHPLTACKRVLRPRGIFIIIGASDNRWTNGFVARPLKALVLSAFVSQRFVMFISKSSKDDLAVIADLMAAGKVTPVIDRRYRLSEASEAIRYLEEGHARGKIVVTPEHNNT